MRPRADSFVRVAAIAAIIGLETYIGGWVVAGLLLSGVAMAAFGPALHRGLPGTGRLGPFLVVLAGVFTVLVVAAPCSPGCPGTGSAWSLVLGGLAAIGLVVRYLGVVPSWPGAQQRLFNTVADFWYLLVAIHLLRRP